MKINEMIHKWRIELAEKNGQTLIKVHGKATEKQEAAIKAAKLEIVAELRAGRLKRRPGKQEKRPRKRRKGRLSKTKRSGLIWKSFIAGNVGKIFVRKNITMNIKFVPFVIMSIIIHALVAENPYTVATV